MGFRLADTVLVGGQPAVVTSISPTEITAISPAAANGFTGSVNVEVDDLPTFSAAAVLSSAVSYDSGSTDALTLDSAPTNTIPIGVPVPFTVTALGTNLSGRRCHRFRFTVTSGTAILSCGLISCPVTTTGDGHATMQIKAVDGTWSVVTAALTNGSTVQSDFMGGTPPVLAALTPQLSIAAGATFNWTVQVLVLANSVPSAGQSVAFTPTTTGIVAQASPAAFTNAAGIATNTTLRRSAGGRPNRDHQRMSQRHQPMRHLYRIRRASGICHASARLRRQPVPLHPIHSIADHIAPARHERQSHGRRIGQSLPGPLCMVSALRRTRSLPARAASSRANSHSHIRHRWHRKLCSRIAPRHRHQPAGHRCIGKHRHSRHRH